MRVDVLQVEQLQLGEWIGFHRGAPRAVLGMRSSRMLSCRVGALDSSTGRCRSARRRSRRTKPALPGRRSSTAAATGSQVHSAAQCGTSIRAGPGVLPELRRRMVAQVRRHVDVDACGARGVEQEVAGAAERRRPSRPRRWRSPETRAPTAVAGQASATCVGERRERDRTCRQPTDAPVAAVARPRGQLEDVEGRLFVRDGRRAARRSRPRAASPSAAPSRSASRRPPRSCRAGRSPGWASGPGRKVPSPSTRKAQRS